MQVFDSLSTDFMPWASSPLGMTIILGLAVLLCGLLMLSGLKGAVKRAVAVAALEAKDRAEREALATLQTTNERLLTSLRTRDRYMVQYEAVSLLGEEAYAQWSKSTWKIVARNQLAMTKEVRPVLYADYRARVRVLSATYGTLPGPALTALRLELEWRAQWRAQPVYEAIPVDERTETLVTSAGVLDWIDNESATMVPVAIEVVPAPVDLASYFNKHLEVRNREIEELFGD